MSSSVCCLWSSWLLLLYAHPSIQWIAELFDEGSWLSKGDGNFRPEIFSKRGSGAVVEPCLLSGCDRKRKAWLTRFLMMFLRCGKPELRRMFGICVSPDLVSVLVGLGHLVIVDVVMLTVRSGALRLFFGVPGGLSKRCLGLFLFGLETCLNGISGLWVLCLSVVVYWYVCLRLQVGGFFCCFFWVLALRTPCCGLSAFQKWVLEMKKRAECKLRQTACYCKAKESHRCEPGVQCPPEAVCFAPAMVRTTHSEVWCL